MCIFSVKRPENWLMPRNLIKEKQKYIIFLFLLDEKQKYIILKKHVSYNMLMF